MSSTWLARQARVRIHLRLASLAAFALAMPGLAAMPARADNYGESLAWQFATPNDIAAQAALRDLIERRRGSVYAAPVYTTNIDRQYNCSVAATATGNSGMQNAVANSPSVTGATSTATGNSNGSSVTGDSPDSRISSGQLNSGAVSSTLVGSTTTAVSGSPWQALNSSQTNSGDQSASVRGSNACAFGVLN